MDRFHHKEGSSSPQFLFSSVPSWKFLICPSCSIAIFLPPLSRSCLLRPTTSLSFSGLLRPFPSCLSAPSWKSHYFSTSSWSLQCWNHPLVKFLPVTVISSDSQFPPGSPVASLHPHGLFSIGALPSVKFLLVSPFSLYLGSLLKLIGTLLMVKFVSQSFLLRSHSFFGLRDLIKALLFYCKFLYLSIVQAPKSCHTQYSNSSKS